jgi:hypothetical protein
MKPVGTKVVTNKGLKQQPFPEKTGPLIHTYVFHPDSLIIIAILHE